MAEASLDNMRRLRRPAAKASSGHRIPANWEAEVCVQGVGHSCTVVDISGAGARLRDLPKINRTSSRVWLLVPHAQPIEAEVAWRDKSQAGLSFVREQGWVLQLIADRFNPAAWLGTRGVLLPHDSRNS